MDSFKKQSAEEEFVFPLRSTTHIEDKLSLESSSDKSRVSLQIEDKKVSYEHNDSQKLKEEWCDLCGQTYTEFNIPMFLKCLHNVCLNCLSKNVRDKSQQLVKDSAVDGGGQKDEIFTINPQEQEYSY